MNKNNNIEELTNLLSNTTFKNIFEILSNRVYKIKFMKKILEKTNKNSNILYTLLSIGIIVNTIFITTIIYFLKKFVSLIVFVKSCIWVFENYDNKNINSDNLVEIIEYVVLGTIMNNISFILSVIPLPLLLFTPIKNILSSIMFLTIIIDKDYRKKICLFIKKYSENKEIHKIFKLVNYVLECINISLINIVYSPKQIFSKLKNTNTINEGINVLINYNNNNEDINVNNDAIEYSDECSDNDEDDDDEESD